MGDILRPGSKELIFGAGGSRVFLEGIETKRGLVDIRTFDEERDSVAALAHITRLAWSSHEGESTEGLGFKQSQQSEQRTRERMAHAVIFLADLDQETVGLCAYYPPKVISGAGPETPPLATQFPQVGTAEWGFMAIDPSAQGAGIPYHFHAAVETLAIEDGVEQIVGRVRRDTEGVHRLYAGMGFEDVGEFQPEGQPYTLVLLSKDMTGQSSVL